MAIDPTTIDATQSPKQLGTAWREYYAEYKKIMKKVLRVNWEDKTPHLEGLFKQLLYGESTAQKSRAKFIRISLQIAEAISEKIKSQPNVYYYKLMPQFSALSSLLLKIINEQAYEIAKARNMRYLANGVRDRIINIESDTKRYVTSLLVSQGKKQEAIQRINQQRLQAANDPRYRRAA